jgi:alpha-1,3-glucosyltransferase
MFGDFEAQRHWLEITWNLNVGDWYRQTEENDLLYWGLDYPPLTAYISLFFAWLSNFIFGKSEIIDLYLSRGKEDLITRLYMRVTVIFCDCIVFLPSAISCWKMVLSETCYRNGSNQQQQTYGKTVNEQIFLMFYLLACFCSPGLLLIDHGHFQYNGVCIGLAIAGCSFICYQARDQKSAWIMDVTGSVLFCLSLNFKQMALYYAPVFFFSLLRRCLQENSIMDKFKRLIVIGATVITTFSILWFPFCIFHATSETCLSSMQLVLQRLFPFNRGIFEDKVGNFWYVVSVLTDIREYIPLPSLVRSSTVITLIFLIPVCIFLSTRRINGIRFILALVVSSMTFFLFSFQVHEKSILLASVPASFLLPFDGPVICWFQLLSVFSMWPLLKRDGLQVAVVGCSVLYYGIVEIIGLINCSKKDSVQEMEKQGSVQELFGESFQSVASPKMQQVQVVVRSVLNYFIYLSYLGMFTLLMLEKFTTPPSRYPDLFPALNAIFSAGNFFIIYAYFSYLLWISKGDEERNVNFSAKKRS